MAQQQQQHDQSNGGGMQSPTATTNEGGNSDELERHIIKRFEIQDRLGKGAYGIVWKAFDRKEGRIVALKNFDAFETVRTLSALSVKFFRTIYFIHSANVIHRDLKPANILLTHPCEIRVADFGLARSLSDPDDNFQNGNLTNYVATRWYRSPEILLGSKRYTKGVDIWSLGTILAEMLRGRPLFTGENTIEQINFIRGALAEPTTQDLHYCDSGLVRSVFNYPPHRDFRRPLDSYMRSSGAPPEAVDLIRRLLHWDPDKRIDLMKAMRHPYVQNYYDPHNVYISDIAVTPFISDDKHFEDPSIYREALYEILHVQEIIHTPRIHQLPGLSAAPDTVPAARTNAKAANSNGRGSPLSRARKTPEQGGGDANQKTRSIPFAQPVGAGGTPVKPPVNARGYERRVENLPPGRRPLEKSNSRQRIVATCEQPAVLYKTSSTGSSNNLLAQGVSTPPRQQSTQQQQQQPVSRTVSSTSVNGTKKAVKFEDDPPPPPPPKKILKEKPLQGDGDGHGSLAKRFSFDGRAIRDRLPYVKRSNSLARSMTPEPARKYPSTTDVNDHHERKTLKEAWRDTLAKSTVPDFFKRTGSRNSKAIQHAASLTPSHNNDNNRNAVVDQPTSEPVRSKPTGYSLNGSYQPMNGTIVAVAFKAPSASVSTSVQSRPAPTEYGTLKSGILHNLKSYSRT
ncbi:Mitogen-activated protein kinase 15 [Hypsibius exemplaris]|uniref:Mitogen-activated protein kinase 15 n=1 Tax=Hypsibius exemplaris TaxID=2072580 RepID=A0A1W0WX11_HYPEX|nr:Mitogen-activated protein kinase 15 [Hypsibius exemplaris]